MIDWRNVPDTFRVTVNGVKLIPGGTAMAIQEDGTVIPALPVHESCEHCKYERDGKYIGSLNPHSLTDCVDPVIDAQVSRIANGMMQKDLQESELNLRRIIHKLSR